MIDPAIFKETKTLAALWQRRIETTHGKEEKRFHAMMVAMLQEPRNKAFLIELLDQSFRASDPSRVADQLEHLFGKYDYSRFFTLSEQALIAIFRKVVPHLSEISITLFVRYLRGRVSTVIIPGEMPQLIKHLQRRREEQTRVNINIIGEAVLSEAEAQSRINGYVKILKEPMVDYISIKISTIFSQINPLAHEWSVNEIAKRLERIYEAAMANTYPSANGKSEHKFVNLDMEEYRDLSLTVDTFMQTLSKPPFTKLYAGIAIQTYLPDALGVLEKLAHWAKERVENGGAPIKVRLVKGANREMELTEASLRGWPCVTYNEKYESDANYKAAMAYLLAPEIAPYVNVGIASHNLFDHALAYALAKHNKVRKFCTAEMLEGMSEAAYETLKSEGIEVILYAPTATAETFTNAVAYLVRRFDENTADENFMRHSFGLKADSSTWKTLEKGFDNACAAIDTIADEPFRVQDRTIPPAEPMIDLETYRFENESDTDFILPQNRRWAETIRDKWQQIGQNGGYHASVVVGGETLDGERRVEVIDKSQYHDGAKVGSYAVASAEQLRHAVETAKADPDNWRKLGTHARREVLMKAAQAVREKRADLIGVAAAEVGKVFTETDVEVSEAIDFLNFYPYSVTKFEHLQGIITSPMGVGLVISPWNFPVAIAAGGIAASLAAGNTVILKPASAAVLSAYMLCECLWNAGVSRNTLQFLPAPGSETQKHLVGNKLVDFVIFTGGESTAHSMIKARPDIRLCAETGGKDATIVTALCDRDQAIKNVIQSAFGNSGQKCSATSLLILEREVYEDSSFKRTLIDAAASLHTGSIWKFENKVGPLVDKPANKLAHALGHLDAAETWALPPSYADNDNPYMLRPAIRWGTVRGDYCHKNELFGPVLAVMCAENLDHAIDLVNATGYGLTSGIESLDEREIEQWKKKINAGNLYINRPTTGAIVLRQPFGGMGKSAIGSGKKAGGLNYVSQFMRIRSVEESTQESMTHPLLSKLSTMLETENSRRSVIEEVLATLGNFAFWNATEFETAHSPFELRGEHNHFRYRGVTSVLLRFYNNDSLHQMLCSYFAAKMAGACVTISIPDDADSKSLLWFASSQKRLLESEDSFVMESELSLAYAFARFERIRYLRPEHVNAQLRHDVADKAYHIAAEPFVPHGRIELMHYYIEQSVSHSYHRYGNISVEQTKNS